MSTQLWKFPIEITDRQTVEMPDDPKIIHVGPDPTGQPCLWALVDDEHPTESIDVLVLGTGNPVPGYLPEHVGSFVQGPFVWHVFAEPEVPFR